MQEQLAQAKEKMQSTFVEGTAAQGLVKVTLNGEKELKKIVISPECVEDVEALQDLIINAFEDAAAKIQDESPMNLLGF